MKNGRFLVFSLMSGLALFEPVALAQDSFKLDVIFVSRFLPEREELEGPAKRLRARLEQHLSETFLVSKLDEVRPFPDYSAEVYLSTCPSNQYVECSYLIGSRAQADWVVSARFSDDPQLAVVNVSIVDVHSSRTVLNFPAMVTEENEPAFFDSLSQVLSAVIEGSAEEVDIRGKFEDPKQVWRRKREESDVAAKEVASLQTELGEMIRGPEGEDELGTIKVTEESLKKYDGRDDATPWQQLQLSKKAYIQFKNTGWDLFEYRRRALGRKNQLLFGASVGGGSGVYEQRLDGRLVLDETTLQPVEAEAFYEALRGPTSAGHLSLGFGLSPTVDVKFRLGGRLSSFNYYFHQEIVNDPSPVGLTPSVGTQTWEAGVQMAYSPMPIRTLRPSFTAGLTTWTGWALSDVVSGGPPAVLELSDYVAPEFLLVDLGAGADLRLSDNVDLFGRAYGSLRLTGDARGYYHSGTEGLIRTRGEATPGGGRFGGGAEVGLTFKVRPFGQPKLKTGPGTLMDDDPDWD